MRLGRSFKRHLLPAVSLIATAAFPFSAQSRAAMPDQRLGRTAAESGPPEWPAEPRPVSGAPNILLVMTDDIGFGSLSTFGGPIPAPVLDQLARTGARYNRFNTTALCSPTRASLLTGREPHNAGMGQVANFATGYDGYTTVIGKSTAMIPEILKEHGYGTAAIGKWHLIPDWEDGPTGPFDRWPTGQGFEYFYGFKGGSADQFAPDLTENTRPVTPPAHDPDYILEKDLADHAIQWIRDQKEVDPAKPFFMYYAPGTAHAPMQAPKDWMAKFRGKFDQGWDAVREETFQRQKKLGVIPKDADLTPRPSFLPAWDSLPPERRRVYARLMEAYAAQLAYSDHELGRVIDALRRMGQLDNTLIIYIEGDNGSSAEGGPQGLFQQESFINQYKEPFSLLEDHIDDIGGPNAHNHYPAAWAWGMDTPFQYYKQVASHFGGTRNGLVISWGTHVAKPDVVRQQFSFVADIVPTILDATHISFPASVNGVAQKPLDGISLFASLANPTASVGHSTQVFEMMQNLGIYHDGWWAGTRPAAAANEITKAQKINLDDRVWELYNIDKDYSQAHDLAAADPQKLTRMKALFFSEAARMKILPIHGIGEGRAGKPSVTAGRNVFTYYAPIARLSESAAPRIVGRGYTITADVTLPFAPANGVLVADGGRFGGYSFYLHDGHPVFYYNATAGQIYEIRAKDVVSPGHHQLKAQFVPDSAEPGAGGSLALSVDGRDVASGRIEHTHRTWISSSEEFDVGQDSLTPVSQDYDVTTSKFGGELNRLTFELQAPPEAPKKK